MARLLRRRASAFPHGNLVAEVIAKVKREYERAPRGSTQASMSAGVWRGIYDGAGFYSEEARIETALAPPDWTTDKDVPYEMGLLSGNVVGWVARRLTEQGVSLGISERADFLAACGPYAAFMATEKPQAWLASRSARGLLLSHNAGCRLAEDHCGLVIPAGSELEMLRWLAMRADMPIDSSVEDRSRRWRERRLVRRARVAG